MDSYVEQIVPVRKTRGEQWLQIGLWVAAVLLILTCVAGFALHLLGMLSILLVALAVGVGYGAYFLSSQMNVEYEYIFTNGDLDVDKILSKRSRKRVGSVKCRDIVRMGKYDPEAHRNETYNEKIVASNVDGEAWYAVAEGDAVSTLLIFKPDDRLLAAMKPYVPRMVMNRAIGGN